MSVEVTSKDQEQTQAFYAACDASMTVDDQELLDRFFAAHRHQAEEAMREHAAAVADGEGVRLDATHGDYERTETNRSAAWNQAVASRRIAAAIRSIDTRGE